MATEFWDIKIADVINATILCVTVFAIIYGPIKAVEIAGDVERKRDAIRRKREIFATLMRTRRTNVLPEHVGALNLIQVEFYGHENVLKAHKDYMAHLWETAPPEPALESFLAKRNDLFFDLLHELSKVVKLQMDKRDIERLGYMPQGWNTDEIEVRNFRRGVIEILEGNKPLPIARYKPQPSSPFPPAPGA